MDSNDEHPRDRNEYVNDAGEDEYLSCLDILSKCQNLLGEIELLQEFISKNKRYRPIEMRRFKTEIKADMQYVHKLSLFSKSAAESVLSSNFTFYDCVWAATKNCSGVRGIFQRFYWQPAAASKRPNKKLCSAVVDIVANDGLEWVKVCNTTEKRMIYDMARTGMVWGSDSDENEERGEDEESNKGYKHDENEKRDESEGIDESDAHPEPVDDRVDDEGLLKVAKSLVKAAKTNRIRYKLPRIRMVLPRVRFGNLKDVDQVLRQISAMGITLQTAGDIKPPLALGRSLDQIPVDRLAGLGDVLNLDCTVLITLVSDLCHAQVPQADWHQKNINQQIEMEKEEPILPSLLWPIFSSRSLVCTSEAAGKLKEIVSIIGTATEKQRADLLMGVPSNMTREQRLEAFQRLSIHEVPKEWRLPISIVNVDVAATIARFPTSGEILSKTFSKINRSIFFYGWASGTTTITTNGVVVREMNRVIEANRTCDEDTGPDIWLFPTPRSLVGTQRVKTAIKPAS